MAKEITRNATISTFKVDDQFERTLRAEFDGANEIIWLTKISIDGTDREEMRCPVSFDDIKRIKSIIDREF